jgi:RNA-directed DNA polymerase
VLRSHVLPTICELSCTIVSNKSGNTSILQTHRQRIVNFTAWVTGLLNIADVYLYPLANVKTKNTMGFSTGLSLFTTAGREQIHKRLRPDLRQEIYFLTKSSIPNQSVEYMDNRISRYSMKMGKCEITGMYLFASDVHCHHYIPPHAGGTDKFNNLRILQKEVGQLIFQTQKETIDVLKNKLGLTELMMVQINKYREKYALRPV